MINNSRLIDEADNTPDLPSTWPVDLSYQFPTLMRIPCNKQPDRCVNALINLRTSTCAPATCAGAAQGRALTCPQVSYLRKLLHVCSGHRIKRKIFHKNLAYVHSFDNHGDSCRLHRLGHRYCDLLRQSFLHLQTSAEDFHDPANGNTFVTLVLEVEVEYIVKISYSQTRQAPFVDELPSPALPTFKKEIVQRKTVFVYFITSRAHRNVSQDEVVSTIRPFTRLNAAFNR